MSVGGLVSNARCAYRPVPPPTVRAAWDGRAITVGGALSTVTVTRSARTSITRWCTAASGSGCGGIASMPRASTE